MPALQSTPLAQTDPDENLLRAVAETAPENPLYTPAFAWARTRRGERPVAFLASSGNIQGCTAFIIQGRIHRDLEIVSAPAVDATHPLWDAIQTFCVRKGITRLRVQSFGSAGGTIPVLGRESSRHQRREYVLDLGPECPPLALSSNHRRNLRRAKRAGIEVTETAEPAAGEVHAALIDLSMSRRQERGEQVSTDTPSAIFRCFLETGAGVLFQAALPDGPVLSSVLVLLSARGAYYHSAGTSPEGMDHGASQLLIATVAQRLRDRGITLFNLGGAAEDQTGLTRFKCGFGPRTVELETASFDVARGHQRVMVAIADRLRTGLGLWRNILAAWR